MFDVVLLAYIYLPNCISKNSYIKPCFLLFISDLVIDPILGVTGDLNRLRICSNDESIELNDASCSRGWWIPEAIKPECVCATGTWLLYENYCNANFHLISGPPSGDNPGSEFTCLKLPTELRRVISLSPQSKSYKQFLIQSNGRHIQQLGKERFSPTSGVPLVIIRLNANTQMYLMHEEGVQSSIRQKCLGKRSIKGYYTHVIKSDETIAYLNSLPEDKLCDDVRDPDFPYERANNTDWLINSVGSYGWSMNGGELSMNPCSCPPPRSRISKMLTPRPRPSSITAPKEGILSNSDADLDYDSLPGDSFSIYPEKRDDLVHAENLIDNAKMTMSILTKLKDFILSGIRPPSFRNPLFKYIRYGRKILTKFCPQIPPEVVGNLVGLFRLLLENIIGKYPEAYNLDFDIKNHERVLSSFDKCLQGMENRTVKFFWEQPGSDNRSCSSKNRRIHQIVVDGKSIALNGEEMPSELRFIDGDVMLEVAWKILLGTHYACSDYFEEYPEDLSFMYMKAQEFFTIPNVMFRWENPAKDLTSAYRILNTHLDPAELGEQIDACVWAAFDTSRFSTWLGRPTSEKEFLSKNSGKLARSGKKIGKGHNKGGMTSKMLNGKSGYCVHDFDDPLGWNEFENSNIGITGCNI